MFWIKKYFVFSLAVSFAFLLSGCFYPTTYVYFEPSSPEGIAYDGVPCGHVTNENNAFKIEVKESRIAVQSHHRKDEKLTLYVTIEPRNNDIDFDIGLFSIKDTTTGKTYVPIEKRASSDYSTMSAKGGSFGETETLLVHWISLTYDVDSDSLTDFQLIFPKGALKMNSKDMKLSPINFKKKKVNTLGYITINC